MREGIAMHCLFRMLCTCMCLTMLDQASAASMLRCESADNTISYASARIANARCSRVDLAWQAGQPVAPVASIASIAPAPAALAPVRASLTRREATTRIYSYVEDGVRHYLTRMPHAMAADVSVIELHFIETCALCASAAEIDIPALPLDTRSYSREIDAAARAFGVDGALVRAVIHAESAYRANAISRAGAQGLMQLMPATALRFHVSDPFDAAQNIRGGVRYLAWLLERFGGDPDLALAAYNSGEAAVDRYRGIPPYVETKSYVSRVKALTERYRSSNPH